MDKWEHSCPFDTGFQVNLLEWGENHHTGMPFLLTVPTFFKKNTLGRKARQFVDYIIHNRLIHV